jgi:hypothetical protein
MDLPFYGSGLIQKSFFQVGLKLQFDGRLWIPELF